MKAEELREDNLQADLHAYYTNDFIRLEVSASLPRASVSLHL